MKVWEMKMNEKRWKRIESEIIWLDEKECKNK